jgi:hypothetical protein
MNSITMNNKNGPLALPNCPFLAFRLSSEENQQGIFKQIICEAGGGYVLGTTDSVNAAQEICQLCDIPTSLNFYHACLNLVPFRVFQDNHVQSYYGCRWRFSRHPQKVPKNMDWCIICGDWFPRPPESLITGLIRLSHEFHHIFLNPPEDGKFPTLPREEDKRRWY